VVAVVPAAGIGRRFGRGGDKLFFNLLGRPVLVWTLEALQKVSEISEVVVVVRRGDLGATEALLSEHGITKVRAVVAGGRERQDSVYKGIQQVLDGDAVVLVHDGARPLVTGELVMRCLGALGDCDGVVAAVPVKDTVKRVTACGGKRGASLVVLKTVERACLWAVQTPQVFWSGTLRAAHEKARHEGFYATDDAGLVERYGGRVSVVVGSYGNIKITTPEDVIIAEALCRAGGGL
jgi:2-C-methyl-D-erythritol 4-phosphate cytidylyltransferase